MKVVRMHGKRAPGRNVCRYGIRYVAVKDGGRKVWETRDARQGEKRAYLRQLRALVRPPHLAPLVVRAAVPPPNPPAGTLSSSVAAGGTLESIARCESGGNPATNTGNGFYGKYQFTLSTWASVGGSGNPAAASEAEQDRRAAMLYAREGAAPWPTCGR